MTDKIAYKWAKRALRHVPANTQPHIHTRLMHNVAKAILNAYNLGLKDGHRMHSVNREVHPFQPTHTANYPCEKCGKPRTKAEGGTIFTVCDNCWDA